MENRMKRKGMQAFIILLGCFCISGCSKKDTALDNKDISNVDQSLEFSDYIEKKMDDNFTVNATVSCPESYRDGVGDSAVFTDTFFIDQSELINKILCSGKSLIDHTVAEDYVGYHYDDGSLCIYKENNILTYGTKQSSYVYNCIQYDEQFDSYNADKYLTDADLPFLDRETAWSECKKILSEIGVILPDEYICYVMDHQIMEQEENAIDSEGNEVEEKKKDSWTQADDCYFFMAEGTWNELPVIGKALQEQGTSEYNIQIMYGKDGIFSLSVVGYYPLEENGEIKIFAPEGAVDRVYKTYSNIISDATYDLVDIQLCQKAKGVNTNSEKIDMELAWACTVTIKESDPSIPEHQRTTYISAVTLEEIL